MQIVDSEAELQNIRDQRENNRREQEMNRIATLPADEQQAATNIERVRQCRYDNTPNSTLGIAESSLSPQLSTSRYIQATTADINKSARRVDCLNGTLGNKSIRCF